MAAFAAQKDSGNGSVCLSTKSILNHNPMEQTQDHSSRSPVPSLFLQKITKIYVWAFLCWVPLKVGEFQKSFLKKLR